MSQINLQEVEDLPTVFTVHVDPEPRRQSWSVGAPVELLSEDGLRIWTPILGPSSVLVARILLAEPGRRWHIGDVAGQLGIGTAYAQRCIRRLAQFGWLAAHIDDGEACYHVVAARTLNLHQVERLHPELAARYARHSGLVGTLR